MNGSSLPLPPGTRAIPAERLDTRTDAEIEARLRNPGPVTGEHNVWTFWDKGHAGMPPWTRRNMINWARRLPRDWTIYVLDIVPGSPLNVDRFLDGRAHFYGAFNRRAIGGLSAGVWYSDILRLALLHAYGGVWVDAGVILVRDFAADIWAALEDPASRFELCGFATGRAPQPDNDIIDSWFIAARKGSPFMRRWHRVVRALWDAPLPAPDDGAEPGEERTDYHGLSRHPLLRQVQPMAVEAAHQAKYRIDTAAYNDYLHTYLACKRARMTVDAADGWDGPAWWAAHAMILPLHETYMLYLATDFSGERQFELLSAQREGVAPAARDATWHAAEALVQALVARCCNVKLSHGLKTTRNKHMASRWEEAGAEDLDVRAGTFAAYLRWASLHLEQVDRPLVPYEVPTTGRTLHAGLLEVVDAD